MNQRQVLIDWTILDRVDQAAAICENQVNATLASFADLDAQIRGLRAHLAQAYELSSTPAEAPASTPAELPRLEDVVQEIAGPADPPAEELQTIAPADVATVEDLGIPPAAQEPTDAHAPLETGPGETSPTPPGDQSAPGGGKEGTAPKSRAPRRRKTPAAAPPVA